MRMLRMLSGLVARLWSGAAARAARAGRAARAARAAYAWRDPSVEMPERNRPVEWTDSGGVVVRGRFVGVWMMSDFWMMDDGWYIYYTPSGWRYAA